MAKKIQTELVVKDSGTKVVSKFSKSTTDSFKKLAVGAGVAATALAAGFVALAKQTIDYGDKLGKLNTRLGVSVQMLDKMKQIADLSGVSFEKITSSFALMARNISEASTGMGIALPAFDKLGISVEKLIKLNPDEQFIALSEAIMKIENPTERMATAMEIFGRSAAELLQLMPDLRKNLDGLNTVWDKQKTKQAEAFNDNLTTMKKNFMDLVTKGVGPAVESLNSFYNLLSNPLLGAENDLRFQQNLVDQAVAAGRKLTDYDIEKLRVLKERVRTLKQLQSTQLTDKEKRMGRSDAVATNVDVSLGAGESNKAAADKKEKVIKDAEKSILDEKKKMADEWDAHIKQMREDDEAEEWQNAIDKVEAEREAAAKRLEVEKKAEEERTKLMESAAKERERLINASSQFFGDRFTSAFMDFANGAKTAADSFRDMTISILQDMAKMLAQQAFMSIFKGLFSSGGGSGGTGFASLFGLAGGGTAQKNKPYIVGEQGPELFVPGRTGQVIPNGAGGSSNTVITVNVDAGENSNINNENANQMGRMISNAVNEQVKKTMLQETRYGGMLNQRQTAMRGT